ncbi:hypothetical protein DICA3_F02058 [Diutina catenulata]
MAFNMSNSEGTQPVEGSLTSLTGLSRSMSNMSVDQTEKSGSHKIRAPQKKATNASKEQLIKWYQEGLEVRDCAQRAGLTQRHAARLIKQWRDAGCVTIPTGTPKPLVKPSDDQWKTIIKLLDENPSIEHDDVLEFFRETLDITISRTALKSLLKEVRVLCRQDKAAASDPELTNKYAFMLKNSLMDFQFNCLFLDSMTFSIIHKKSWFTAAKSDPRSYTITVDMAMSYEGVHHIAMRHWQVGDGSSLGRSARLFMKRVLDSIDRSKIQHIIAFSRLEPLIMETIYKEVDNGELRPFYIPETCNELTPFQTFWTELRLRMGRDELRTDTLSDRLVQSANSFKLTEIQGLIDLAGEFCEYRAAMEVDDFNGEFGYAASPHGSDQESSLQRQKFLATGYGS